jgi:hypothetical protein
MTKDRAREVWDEYKWWIAAVVLPFTLWAAKSYDAAKLDAQVFVRYVDQQEAQRALRELRDSARQERVAAELRYLICRQDFSRQQCLRPNR